MSTGRPRLRPALMLSVFAVLVAGLASLVYFETAAIKIAVPPQRLEANVVLNIGAGGKLALQQIEAQVTDSAQGTASSVTVAPAYASGSVRYIFTCQRIDTCPQPVTIPAGVIVATRRGHMRFVTQSPATFPSYLGRQVQTVGIRAAAPGAAYNVGPGWIQLVDNPPWLGLQAVNDRATRGGVDGGTAQIVQQSDLDAVQATLATRVKNELATAMVDKTIGMTYSVDGPAALTSTSDYAVGDQTPTFTLTMTGKLRAGAFSNNDAQAILHAALQPGVLPGYALAAPIHATYQFVRAANSNDLVVSADAVGYAMPRQSMTNLEPGSRDVAFPTPMTDFAMTCLAARSTSAPGRFRFRGCPSSPTTST